MLDKEANRNAPTDKSSRISLADSKVEIWVVPTDEELVILQEVAGLLLRKHNLNH
jgi:acetate kinase